MIEVIKQISSTAETFGPEYTGMTANLAARMMIYDEALEVRKTLSVGCAELEEPLLHLNEDVLMEDLASEIAYSALGLYVLKKKLKDVDAKLATLRLVTSLVEPLNIINQKIRVSSVDRGRNVIGTSKMNRYGQLDGKSKWHSSVVGNVTKINVGPEYGGWLQIAGRMGRIHTAAPLIDRNDGYKPKFEIEQL